MYHFAEMFAEKDNAAARNNALGVNHLLQAQNVDRTNAERDEHRRVGATLSLAKQNELFPNNIQFRMQQKLDAQMAEFGEKAEIE